MASEPDFWIKVAMSVAVIIIGTPTLPLTSGLSAAVIIGILLMIWGFDGALEEML